MSLKPLHDWAVIRPSEAEEVTAGGLYIPESAKDKPRQGVVEAIGPGAFEEEKYGKKKIEKKDRKFIPTTVKPGDVVVYAQYADRTYKVDGEERVLVRERDILGTLPGGIAARPRPLQLPATTSGQALTALIKHVPASLPVAAPRKKAAKKAAKKTVKKAAKKAVVKKKQATKKKTLKKKAAAGKKTKSAVVRKKAKKKTGRK